jgi:putative ABC transport system permease protein
MITFATELRQAWRSLRQRKAYFFTCAATLTLVLGANAAIFAVVNATMLRPLPFAARGEVLYLFSQPPGTSTALQRNPLQQMDVIRIRERARTLARLEGFYLTERVVTLNGEPGVAQSAAVTPGLMSMLAAPIAQGRGFLDSEAQPGQFVALVTDRYWRETLGSARVIGTSMVIDGRPHTIIGILSPSFAAPFIDAQVFTTLFANPEPQPRAPPRTVVSVAELAPGASLAQTRDELASISRQMSQEFPATHNGWILGAQPVREWLFGAMRTPLLMLFAATVLVLLIACVNIANLASAQALARSGELSLRLALGASRGDVARLHLAELLIVCASGLIPGVLVAASAVPALLAINPTVAQKLGGVPVDWRVQIFSAAVAILAACIASAVPAIRAVRGQISSAVAASSLRTTGSRAATRTQRALVSIEVALCVALLMAGGVVIKGLWDLSQRSPGYESIGVLTAQVRLPEVAYNTHGLRAATVQRMLDGIRGLPGVTSASTTQNVFTPNFTYQTLIGIKDRPTSDGQLHTVQFRRVSPDYFKTMRIRTLAGRTFSDDDVVNRPQVAVISRRFADSLLQGADPVGQVLTRSAANLPALTVIGVADDALDVSVTERPEPTLYLPWAQNNNSGVPIAFVIRTSADPASLVGGVREVVRGVDASLPLRRVQPLDVFVQESTAPERFRTTVLAIVALLGLALAAVGISGVTYRGVVDRSKEFAVRLALGSQPSAVVGLVLTESIRDLLIGASVGLFGGAALCAVLARSMENIARIDLLITGAAIGVIAVVGIAAAFVPALRVMRVHPAEVLRS